MQRTVVAPLVAALAALSVFSCSWDEPAPGPGAAQQSSQGAEERVEKIPILPGYKYYAGGPVMKADAYGTYRLQKFQGEVEQPPSRGMIFGAKQEGDELEYRVWANGRMIALHKGTMRDGLFWQTYAESYRSGKLTARERDEHLDDEKKTRAVTEDIDPETGEVIRTKENFVSYYPPDIPEDVDAEDPDDEEGAAPEPSKP